MKKLNAIIALVLSLCILFTGCSIFKETAKGKNVKVDYTGTDHVSFYPICPKCDHVSLLRSANISDGEYQEGTHICEACNEIYEVSIDRR